MWVELCLFAYAKPVGATQIRIGFNWYCLGILLLRILPWCLTEMIRIIVVLIFFFLLPILFRTTAVDQFGYGVLCRVILWVFMSSRCILFLQNAISMFSSNSISISCGWNFACSHTISQTALLRCDADSSDAAWGFPFSYYFLVA